MLLLALIVGGYLVGSVPTGFLVGKYGYDTDVRRYGSGNIGFTNIWRVLGPAAAMGVLIGDTIKGALPVLAAGLLFTRAPTILHGQTGPLWPDSLAVVLTGLATIAGNNFSIYLGFGGGKGVAVAAGVLLVLVPVVTLILLVIWLIVLALTRYVSVASIVIALVFPSLMLYLHRANVPYVIFALAAGLLIIFSHRGNISRLIKGTELRIGQALEKP